jgi:hypothetical protein
MPDSSIPCPSCGAPIEEAFCGACGEGAPRRITFGGAAGELKDQLVGLDFGIVHTVRDLFVDPGVLLRGYLSGRRQRVTRPFKFLFLMATLYVLVVTALDVQVSFGAGAQETALVVAAVINYLVFLFLLPSSAVLRLLFRKSGYNWAETYVVVCYTWGGYLFVAAALGAVMAGVDEWYFFARSAVGILFITYCVHGFYRVKWPVALAKSMAFFLAYFVLTGIVMSLLITLAYSVGFEPLQLAGPLRGR